MTYSKLRLLLVLGLGFLFSCSDNNLTLPTKDVYVTGTIAYGDVKYDSAVSIATYWKNGVLIKLSRPPIQTNANAIAVSGNDVYVAGESGVLISISNGMTSPGPLSPHATFWKNGVMQQLSDSISYAHAIAVSGSDVYVAGENSYGAALWKNGVLMQLSNSFSFANSISVVGSDVYVAGYLVSLSTYTDTPVYWKNGVIVQLSNPTSNAIATGIAISGTDIYVSGQMNNNTAVYWKNGAINALESLQWARANGIAVIGSDVYVPGSITDGTNRPIAGYWKNGVLMQLPEQPFSQALSIAVSGNDVYIAGEFPTGAGYWKNGVGNILIGTQLGPFEASGIFVK